jgi:DNA polymerase I
MIDLQAFLDARAPEVRMIMQVHDELVFEGPEKPLRQIAPELAARMCRIFTLGVPLVADWGIGYNWDEAHEPQGHASSAAC